MLSRTAHNLYWLARGMERADYTARLLQVGLRMSSISASTPEENYWHSTMVAAGCEAAFLEKHQEANGDRVIDFLLRDRDNPSSILATIETARQSARAVRTALTSDMWHAINGTWLEAKNLRDADLRAENLSKTLDWVKTRAVLFDGACTGTMLRNDGYYFTRLGASVERADNTARILDVKYHVLLPDHEDVGGGLDYYQWTAILRSVSALRAYHWVYRTRVRPWNVAELLILRPEMPRSLRASYDEITTSLDLLAESYGGHSGECHRLAGEMRARLKFGRVDDIFQSGLHEFLTDYVDRTIDLGNEISRFYLM